MYLLNQGRVKDITKHGRSSTRWMDQVSAAKAVPSYEGTNKATVRSID